MKRLKMENLLAESGVKQYMKLKGGNYRGANKTTWWGES